MHRAARPIVLASARVHRKTNQTWAYKPVAFWRKRRKINNVDDKSTPFPSVSPLTFVSFDLCDKVKENDGHCRSDMLARLDTLRDARILLSQLRQLLRPYNKALDEDRRRLREHRLMLRNTADLIVQKFGASIIVDAKDINSLLHAYLLLDNHDRFHTLWNTYAHIPKSAYSYNMLISMILARNDILGAMHTVKDQLQMGQILDPVCIASVLGALRQRGYRSEALRFFEILCGTSNVPTLALGDHINNDGSLSHLLNSCEQTSGEQRKVLTKPKVPLDTPLACWVIAMYIEESAQSIPPILSLSTRNTIIYIFDRITQDLFPFQPSFLPAEKRYFTCLRLIELYLRSTLQYNTFQNHFCRRYKNMDNIGQCPFDVSSTDATHLPSKSQPYIQGPCKQCTMHASTAVNTSDQQKLFYILVKAVRALVIARRWEIRSKKVLHAARLSNDPYRQALYKDTRHVERLIALIGLQLLFDLRYQEDTHRDTYSENLSHSCKQPVNANPTIVHSQSSISSLPWWPSQQVKRKMIHALAAACERGDLYSHFVAWHKVYHVKFYKPPSV